VLLIGLLHLFDTLEVDLCLVLLGVYDQEVVLALVLFDLHADWQRRWPLLEANRRKNLHRPEATVTGAANVVFQDLIFEHHKFGDKLPVLLFVLHHASRHGIYDFLPQLYFVILSAQFFL